MDAPELVRIIAAKKETPTVTTLTLDKEADGGYGQFYMIWIPSKSSGEKPYASSNLKGKIQLTVKKVGPCSEALADMRRGDYVGVRGPYGRGQFRVEGKNICFVAGGVGIAPLIPVIEGEERRGRRYTVVFGAKTKEELFFIDRIKKSGAKLYVVTDDGSAGEKMFPHQCFEKLLGKNKFDQVLCCGPEVMMKEVLEIVLREKIPCQMSLERFMKCGIGLCGSCALDPRGELVCREGPVFDAERLAGTEFGLYRRDAAGSKIKI